VPPAPPPPYALRDGFEDREPGLQPEHASVSEEGTATIRVTDEAAFSGNQSLRFTDAAGLSKPYNPHLVYQPHIKHGAATHIVLTLDYDETGGWLCIEDNGRGLPTEPMPDREGGSGLRIMRHRAEVFGGELSIGPGPKGGVRVICRFPAVSV